MAPRYVGRLSTGFSPAEWSSRRDDPQIAGVFGSLPTLTWDGRTISETLPIASFVASRLGERDGLDDVSFALREGIVSCAYLEIILGVAPAALEAVRR